MGRQALDVFIASMEEKYQPHEAFAAQTREALYRMLDRDIPEDQVCWIFQKAEDRYKAESQMTNRATTRTEHLESIAKGCDAIAANLKRMVAAYESTAEILDDSSSHLRGAARQMHETGVLLTYSNGQLKDSARKLEETVASVYENKKEYLGTPLKEEMH